MKKSAGILLYKILNDELMVLLVHPGGPFWANKDLASWSIPKGEFNDEEQPLEAAIREFAEETGILLQGDFMPLEPVKLKSGKMVYAWALERDIDADSIISNEFELEWPPKSGLLKRFPEVDKAAWFSVGDALQKINPSQQRLMLQLAAIVG